MDVQVIRDLQVSVLMVQAAGPDGCPSDPPYLQVSVLMVQAAGPDGCPSDPGTSRFLF